MRVIRNRVDGVAEPLPAGETVLWSGRPDAWRFARRQFRLGWVAVWFLGLATWRGAETWNASGDVYAAFSRAFGQLPLALAALALLGGLGIWMARSTTYALTRRRIVMNIGVALPITMNFPLRFVDGAVIRKQSGPWSDLIITLAPGAKVNAFAQWPHLLRARDPVVTPMMRDVPSRAIDALVPLLAEALKASDAEIAAENTARAADGLASAQNASTGSSPAAGSLGRAGQKSNPAVLPGLHGGVAA